MHHADGRGRPLPAHVHAETLHECRHGYASLMIAAGVNVKALSTFMGHANIRITLDQYGHLLPRAEDEAAGLLDAFLARQLGGAGVRADCSADCSAPRLIPVAIGARRDVLHLGPALKVADRRGRPGCSSYAANEPVNRQALEMLDAIDHAVRDVARTVQAGVSLPLPRATPAPVARIEPDPWAIGVFDDDDAADQRGATHR